jgi:hypothetical protein
MLSLVYFEQFTNVEAAIAREKEIKGWRREKKNKFVESVNPTWKGSCSGLVSKRTNEGRHADRLQQKQNIKSLRAARPLMKTRAHLRPSG